MGRIFVFGSFNVDLVFPVERLPLPGETLAGGDLAIHAGGKGGNQAVAAARLGVRTAAAGMIGSDLFGDLVLESQRDGGVETSKIRRSNQPTGIAVITVLPDGQNSIILSPGANAQVSPAFAEAALASLRRDDILLCQLETPLEAVDAALGRASAVGARAMLDPAPFRALPASLLRNVAVLTPNQSEAAGFLRHERPIASVPEALQAARQLQAQGPEVVVIKLGDLGCIVCDQNQPRHYPAFDVKAIDTTAAGDVFNAALAVALLEGIDWEAGARFANAAAAISVTRRGAQSSAPTREDVLRLIETGITKPEVR